MKPRQTEFAIEFIHANPHPVRTEVNWYRWEFLRRNPKYCADYQKFIKRFGHWLEIKGYWYEETRRQKNWTKSDKKYFDAHILPVVGALCEKWKILNLLPPDWRFNRKTGMRKVAGGSVELPTIVAPGWNWSPPLFKMLVKLGFLGTADSAKRYGNVVLAEFDLNWPMKDLLDYAKRVLTYGRMNYEKELRKNGVRIPKSRRRLTDYDVHLRVWDLKQENLSAPEIAQLVFPADSPASAFQKVRDHLNSATKLVTGRPTDIR
jgi:hypothetical protein